MTDVAIVTLTANPSLDRTISLAAPLQPGEVQPAIGAREDAGGKGINVARVMDAAGVATCAVLPLDAADPFATALAATALPVSAVPISGDARSNVAITDAAGVTTKLNLAGAVLTAADGAAIVEAVVAASEKASWVVLAGSLPPGLPTDFYVTVAGAVRARWGAGAPRIAIDTSGAALDAAVAKAHPDLIKPNEDELAALVGESLDATIDVVDAVIPLARRVVPAQAAAALVTLGSRGALYIDAEHIFLGTPPKITVRSTVGAGDSSLAGFLIADLAGLSPAQCLESSIRYGAGAASQPGTEPPTPATVPQGEIPISELSA